MRKSPSTIVKANNIIEAKYKLNTREQKVLLLFISMLRPDHKSGHVYHTHVNEISEILNQNDAKWGDAYDSFKEIVTTLKSKPLHLENDKELIICNWLGSVTIVKQSGEIKFAFEPQLEPFLFEVKKNFTKYPLQNIIKLKSGFSIRVYELLKQYATIGKRRFELQDLRAMLGLEENAYPRYYDFKRRVLLTAQNELKKKTDISFTFKEERHGGKKISSLVFFITQQKQDNDEELDQLDISLAKTAVKNSKSVEQSKIQFDYSTNTDTEVETDEKEVRLTKRLKEFGLDDWQVQKIVNEVGAEAQTGIWRLINEIKMFHRDGKIKGSLSGYAAKVIDAKYQLKFFRD